MWGWTSRREGDAYPGESQVGGEDFQEEAWSRRIPSPGGG